MGQREKGMKKYPRYGLRVSEELEGALRRAGADRVREVLAGAFLGRDGLSVPSWSKGVVEGSSVFSGSAAPVADAPVSAPREVDEAGQVPAEAVEVIRERAQGRTEPLPVVRSKVFTQTPEERAEKLKMLQGMKLMPQMVKPPDFFPDEEYDEPA